jgi:hypothetical protein
LSMAVTIVIKGGPANTSSPVNRGRSPHPAVSDTTYIPTM